MKRIAFLMGLVALLALLVAPVVALDDIAIPSGGFYDGAADATARLALSNNLTVAYTAAITAQTDTNVTTTVTAYTPRRAGDLLVGGAGTGTNLVCVSKGTTTNDWVQVAP
jgi:hypothetical protein